MKKKAFAALCAAVTAASCCLAQTAFADSGLTVVEPTTEFVKPLGRTYYNGESLWLSLTSAGIEYQFTGTHTEITITGDGNALGSENGARIGFFADGVRVKDIMLTQAPQTVSLDLDENVLHTIKVIKLSESANSSILIDEIAVDGEGDIAPTAEKAHKIEFIGDSITCGYGVDGASQNENFKTSTEDGSRTYAYKTAEKFNAEYSMVSYSGYGVLSGYTSNNAANPNTNQLVSNYYDKLGFSYGWVNGQTISDVDWDFSYTPDLVVINLGTNDYHYVQNNEDRIADFEDAYIDLIKLVREKNPDAEILCTLGIMGQELYPAIENAVSDYITETGDAKVNAFEFDNQDQADGLGSDWHPSEVTHTKAAEKLINEISALYGWEIDESVDISPVDGKLAPTVEKSEKPSTSSDVSGESSAAESSANSESSSTVSNSTSSAASTSSSGSSKKDSNPDTGFAGIGASAAVLLTSAAIVIKKRRN